MEYCYVSLKILCTFWKTLYTHRWDGVLTAFRSFWKLFKLLCSSPLVVESFRSRSAARITLLRYYHRGLLRRYANSLTDPSETRLRLYRQRSCRRNSHFQRFSGSTRSSPRQTRKTAEEKKCLSKFRKDPRKIPKIAVGSWGRRFSQESYKAWKSDGWHVLPPWMRPKHSFRDRSEGQKHPEWLLPL